MIQAERLDKKEFYTSYRLEEFRVQAIRQILTELYMERANLEYEMHLADVDEDEVLRKLEKLQRYIAKAERLFQRGCERMASRLRARLNGMGRMFDPIRVEASV